MTHTQKGKAKMKTGTIKLVHSGLNVLVEVSENNEEHIFATIRRVESEDTFYHLEVRTTDGKNILIKQVTGKKNMDRFISENCQTVDRMLDLLEDQHGTRFTTRKGKGKNYWKYGIITFDFKGKK